MYIKKTFYELVLQAELLLKKSDIQSPTPPTTRFRLESEAIELIYVFA
jgi:hypothetical protein